MEREKLPFELQERESVVLVCRRHPVYLAAHLAKNVLAGLIPAIALLVLVGMTAGLDGAVGIVVFALVALWLVYWGIRAYFTWYRFNNDYWVITDQRIVDSIKRHWFHHQMSSADLVNVEDLSISKSGLIHTAFNFGDVRCQTSATQPNFVLSGIPQPAKVLATVDSLRDAARREFLGRTVP